MLGLWKLELQQTFWPLSLLRILSLDAKNDVCYVERHFLFCHWDIILDICASRSLKDQMLTLVQLTV